MVACHKKTPSLLARGVNGAANQNRTDDLVITNDVLYRLSHSSVTEQTGMELLIRIELMTSSLPMTCSTD